MIVINYSSTIHHPKAIPSHPTSRCAAIHRRACGIISSKPHPRAKAQNPVTNVPAADPLISFPVPVHPKRHRYQRFNHRTFFSKVGFLIQHYDFCLLLVRSSSRGSDHGRWLRLAWNLCRFGSRDFRLGFLLDRRLGSLLFLHAIRRLRKR